MKVPIPHDWDGETWRCVQVIWPSSVGWLATLVGLLSTPQRGRYWDENTGKITDIQEIGREILDRNIPLTACVSGDTDALLSLASIIGGGSCLWDGLEDLTMPCIDISNLLKIEDGVLYAMDACCEWVAVGTIAGASLPVGDDAFEPLTPTYSACGKAYAVIDAVYQVMESCWDETDNYPWDWVGHVRGDCPNLSLSATRITEIIVGMIVVEQLMGRVDAENLMFDASTRQGILCRLEAKLDSTVTIPDDLAEMLRSLFFAEFSVGIADVGQLFQSAIWAIGTSEIRDIARLGSTVTDQDCDCPEIIGGYPTAPTASGWYLSAPFAQIEWPIPPSPDWGYPYVYQIAPHHIYGVQFQMQYVSGGAIDRLKRSNDLGTLGITPDVTMNETNSDYLGLSKYLQASTSVCAEIYPGGEVGVTFLDGAGGKHSSVIGSPSASKNQSVAMVLAGRADPAAIWRSIEWRWVHNINDGTH